MSEGDKKKPAELVSLPEGGVSSEEWDRRTKAYASMGECLDSLGGRAVLVAFEAGTDNAHIVVHDPGSDTDAEKVLLTAQHALYSLSLYIARLQDDIAAQKQRDPS